MQDTENHPLPFGLILKKLMDEAGLSNHALARAAGISETAVRRMLKTGVDENQYRPEPEVLDAICKVLPLDFYQTIQYVYGVDQPIATERYSVEALALAELYDRLDATRQNVLRSTVYALAREQGYKAFGTDISHVEAQVRPLKVHTLFGKRRPHPIAKSTWFLNRLLPQATHDAMVELLIYALNHLFPEGSPEHHLVPADEESLMAVLNHRLVEIALRMLIADASPKSSIERIYWLFFIWTDNTKIFPKLKPEHHAALADLWRVLTKLVREDEKTVSAEN